MGQQPDVIVCNSRMDDYCLIGNMKEALTVLDAVVSVGHKPNVLIVHFLTGNVAEGPQGRNGYIIKDELFC